MRSYATSLNPNMGWKRVAQMYDRTTVIQGILRIGSDSLQHPVQIKNKTDRHTTLITCANSDEQSLTGIWVHYGSENEHDHDLSLSVNHTRAVSWLQSIDPGH